MMDTFGIHSSWMETWLEIMVDTLILSSWMETWFEIMVDTFCIHSTWLLIHDSRIPNTKCVHYDLDKLNQMPNVSIMISSHVYILVENQILSQKTHRMCSLISGRHRQTINLPPNLFHMVETKDYVTRFHTLRVHYAHAAANLNSGYSKYSKVARVHYFCTIALRTSRAVLTRA